MKQYLSTFAGSAICGGFAFGIWPELWKTYGLMGGWLAATLIIGIMWYMNHYHGAILNPPGKIWLDQGWCIGSYNRQIKKFPTEKQNVSLKHILT